MNNFKNTNSSHKTQRERKDERGGGELDERCESNSIGWQPNVIKFVLFYLVMYILDDVYYLFAAFATK